VLDPRKRGKIPERVINKGFKGGGVSVRPPGLGGHFPKPLDFKDLKYFFFIEVRLGLGKERRPKLKGGSVGWSCGAPLRLIRGFRLITRVGSTLRENK